MKNIDKVLVRLQEHQGEPEDFWTVREITAAQWAALNYDATTDEGFANWENLGGENRDERATQAAIAALYNAPPLLDITLREASQIKRFISGNQ